ncbi:MAG: hypothetical protein AOA65_0629 [Candidatus Bathyarchaeota archaeon BA1]|nr:MAG: hypothetical protein AOA65_0629 [Candidatus Bathyarchaeota archaeon BA1]
MVKVRILVIPNHIKSAALRAAKYLEKIDYDAVFLNFSRDLEEGIRALAEGAPYNFIIERLKKLRLVPEPFGAWGYSAEPILLALRGILNKRPDIKIHCYRDSSFDLLSVKMAERIALLTFRVCSTGKINAEEWESLLKSFLEPEAEALKEETDFIARKAESSEDGICVAGFNGRYIRTRLMEEGYNTSLAYLYIPYHFTPIEVLLREMRRATVRGNSPSYNRITQLVQHHVQFIREYVTINEDYDEAYSRWVCEKAPWLMCLSRVLEIWPKLQIKEEAG